MYLRFLFVYVFQTDIMYYVMRVCYSSFMNYYGILISAASYSDISVSVIVFHLLQIYLQCGILSNSSPACVDANG